VLDLSDPSNSIVEDMSLIYWDRLAESGGGVADRCPDCHDHGGYHYSLSGGLIASGNER
jgi:hypothetical protein